MGVETSKVWEIESMSAFHLVYDMLRTDVVIFDEFSAATIDATCFVRKQEILSFLSFLSYLFGLDRCMDTRCVLLCIVVQVTSSAVTTIKQNAVHLYQKH